MHICLRECTLVTGREGGVFLGGDPSEFGSPTPKPPSEFGAPPQTPVRVWCNPPKSWSEFGAPTHKENTPALHTGYQCTLLF